MRGVPSDSAPPSCGPHVSRVPAGAYAAGPRQARPGVPHRHASSGARVGGGLGVSAGPSRAVLQSVGPAQAGPRRPGLRGEATGASSLGQRIASSIWSYGTVQSGSFTRLRCKALGRLLAPSLKTRRQMNRGVTARMKATTAMPRPAPAPGRTRGSDRCDGGRRPRRQARLPRRKTQCQVRQRGRGAGGHAGRFTSAAPGAPGRHGVPATARSPRPAPRRGSVPAEPAFSGSAMPLKMVVASSGQVPRPKR